jgi:hypothetical protein
MSEFSIYPDAIDGYAQLPLIIDKVTSIDAVTVNRLREAIINIETELGISPSGIFDTVTDRLDFLNDDLNSSITTLEAEIVALEVEIDSLVIITDHADLINIIWAAGGHTGTPNYLAGFDGSGNPTNIDPGTVGGAADLASTLAAGNISGGTDIILSLGDEITGVDGATGTDLIIRPGNGSSGADGAIHVSSGTGSYVGNSRGENAVDLQRARTFATQVASGVSSFVAGYKNTSSGNYSNSLGWYVSATGSASHAQGYYSSSAGFASHTEGIGTVVTAGTLLTGYNSGAHAEGSYTTSSSKGSHSEGGETTASGVYSHSEGWGTISSGNYSHAEGQYTTATGKSAHAEGRNTNAAGYAHAEGNETDATANGSHSEGTSSLASGIASHAEGDSTHASGTGSHAEGIYSRAIGDHSNASGRESVADVIAQFARSSGDRSIVSSGKGGTQFSLYHLGIRTTSSTPAVLKAGSSGANNLVLRASMTHAFRIMITARQDSGSAGSTGDSASWIFTGQIKRDASNDTTLTDLWFLQTLTLVDEAVDILTYIASSVAETPTFFDAGAAAWTIGVTANNTDESLEITATGETNKNILWSALVITTEAGLGQNL